MTVWCFLRLPETLRPEDRRELRAGPIYEAFAIVVGNRVASGYAIGTGLTFGCLFGFLNSAQQIYADLYGLGALFPGRLRRRCGADRGRARSPTPGSSSGSACGGCRIARLVGFAAISALLCAIAFFDDGHVPFSIFFL